VIVKLVAVEVLGLKLPSPVYPAENEYDPALKKGYSARGSGVIVYPSTFNANGSPWKFVVVPLNVCSKFIVPDGAPCPDCPATEVRR
jgi:hypothetical protein